MLCGGGGSDGNCKRSVSNGHISSMWFRNEDDEKRKEKELQGVELQ